MGLLEGGLETFGITLERWRETAQHRRPADRWFRGVKAGVEACMRKWHGAGESDAEERHVTAATETRTVNPGEVVRGDGDGSGEGRGGG